MENWFKISLKEFGILWLLLSSIVGGIVGASIRLIFENIIPKRLQQKRDVLAVECKYRMPILYAAEALRNRLANIINNINLIVKDNWLKYAPPKYYYISTLF